MFREVPVLPVVVPTAAAVLAVLVWRLHLRGRLSPARAAVAVVVCVYAAGVVANTVFPIFLDKPSYDVFWTVYLTPLVGYDVSDAIMNVVVFVPIGILVPLVLSRGSWRRALAVTASLSLMIELAQLVTGSLWAGGHVADVNDLAFNVIGGLIGIGSVAALSTRPAGSVLIDRLRW